MLLTLWFLCPGLNNSVLQCVAKSSLHKKELLREFALKQIHGLPYLSFSRFWLRSSRVRSRICISNQLSGGANIINTKTTLWIVLLTQTAYWVSASMCVKLLQLYPRLCDPMNCSLPGSSVHGILQEYWSGLPFPFPGDLPDLGIEPVAPALQVDSLPLDHWGSPLSVCSTPRLLLWEPPLVFQNTRILWPCVDATIASLSHGLLDHRRVPDINWTNQIFPLGNLWLRLGDANPLSAGFMNWIV